MITACILCDSLSPAGTRLTTMKVTMPRFLLAEFNTHRVFSRNTGSSRAISVARRIAAVRSDPFMPSVWGQEQRGMQAEANITNEDTIGDAQDSWRRAAYTACEAAEQLSAIGVHKQIVNRLLEPFCWVDVIVSSTTWTNFFALRCSGGGAQPEMQVLADAMRDGLNSRVPDRLEWGAWHLPLVNREDLHHVGTYSNLLALSAGRVAAVSYERDGFAVPSVSLALAARLQRDGHWSPFEHIAQARAGKSDRCRNFIQDWDQYRAVLETSQTPSREARIPPVVSPNSRP